MDRVLVVTGRSRGICAAVGTLSALEGYAVCINDRIDEAAAQSVVNEVRGHGGKAITVKTDVGDEQDVPLPLRDRQPGAWGR